MPPVFSKPAVEQLYSVPFELSYMKETTDYSTIRVSHEFTIATEPVAAGTNSTTHPALPRSQRHVTRKEDLPYVPDSSDKNLLFYAIDAFEEACHADRLKLNTDEKKNEDWKDRSPDCMIRFPACLACFCRWCEATVNVGRVAVS